MAEDKRTKNSKSDIVLMPNTVIFSPIIYVDYNSYEVAKVSKNNYIIRKSDYLVFFIKDIATHTFINPIPSFRCHTSTINLYSKLIKEIRREILFIVNIYECEKAKTNLEQIHIKSVVNGIEYNKLVRIDQLFIKNDLHFKIIRNFRRKSILFKTKGTSYGRDPIELIQQFYQKRDKNVDHSSAVSFSNPQKSTGKFEGNYTRENLKLEKHVTRKISENEYEEPSPVTNYYKFQTNNNFPNLEITSVNKLNKNRGLSVEHLSQINLPRSTEIESDSTGIRNINKSKREIKDRILENKSLEIRNEYDNESDSSESKIQSEGSNNEKIGDKIKQGLKRFRRKTLDMMRVKVLRDYIVTKDNDKNKISPIDSPTKTENAEIKKEIEKELEKDKKLTDSVSTTHIYKSRDEMITPIERTFLSLHDKTQRQEIKEECDNHIYEDPDKLTSINTTRFKRIPPTISKLPPTDFPEPFNNSVVKSNNKTLESDKRKIAQEKLSLKTNSVITRRTENDAKNLKSALTLDKNKPREKISENLTKTLNAVEINKKASFEMHGDNYSKYKKIILKQPDDLISDQKGSIESQSFLRFNYNNDDKMKLLKSGPGSFLIYTNFISANRLILCSYNDRIIELDIMKNKNKKFTLEGNKKSFSTVLEMITYFCHYPVEYT